MPPSVPTSAPTPSRAAWLPVGSMSPQELSDARLQIHHAAQIPVAATISYLVARPDDSHTALRWVASLRALVTEPIPAVRPFRIALWPADLTLLALEGAEEVPPAPGSADVLPLDGRTVVDAYAWLRNAVERAELDPLRLTERKHYEIATHAVASGGEFSVGSRRELTELDRYWSNAAGVLDEVAARTEGASRVLCWPHHFDTATLITPPQTGARRTIGVGHSPGDEWYAEPYWYVAPHPQPKTDGLPMLAGGGHWHTAGWVGAVLPASAYVNSPDQRAAVLAFIESAVSASRALIGVSDQG